MGCYYVRWVFILSFFLLWRKLKSKKFFSIDLHKKILGEKMNIFGTNNTLMGMLPITFSQPIAVNRRIKFYYIVIFTSFEKWKLFLDRIFLISTWSQHLIHNLWTWSFFSLHVLIGQFSPLYRTLPVLTILWHISQFIDINDGTSILFDFIFHELWICCA